MLRALVVAAISVFAIGCNNDSTGSGLKPTIVTPPARTETFTGSVAVGGSMSHGFTSQNYGEVDITLTAAGPPVDIVMGVGIGAPSFIDSTCQLYQNGSLNTPAGATPQLVGNVPAGAYCVMVFDAGNQTAPIAYSVTVVHPR